MKGLDVKEILIAVGAFVVLGLVMKIVSLTVVSNIFSAFLPVSDYSAIYLALFVTIALTGFLVGKLIAVRVNGNPYAHALAVSIIAGTYRLFFPDFDPLPILLVGIFALLSFMGIMVGAHASLRK
ncbi:hypothetical protein [Marinobacter confluentis]|uniref:Uncharacterized protein n=1 Tax=Marinobacter confluentis TaxID=1697557 RepID=A0A4Z1CE02_9GAMM|nr:hypothetical protein [Marinobacter confluentis]TGN37908.1 hypothetical protein E5Q11_17200 [Marinobacter confluentis]